MDYYSYRWGSATFARTSLAAIHRRSLTPMRAITLPPQSPATSARPRFRATVAKPRFRHDPQLCRVIASFWVPGRLDEAAPSYTFQLRHLFLQQAVPQPWVTAGSRRVSHVRLARRGGSSPLPTGRVPLFMTVSGSPGQLVVSSSMYFPPLLQHLWHVRIASIASQAWSPTSYGPWSGRAGFMV